MHGRVKVGEIHSQGELAGEFDADIVQLSGTVKDNTVIRAKSLEVKLTPADGKMQVIFGECKLEVGQATAPAEVAVTPRLSDHPSPPPKVASIRPPSDTNGA